MFTSTLRNVGGSVMMAIPKSLLEGLGLSANTKVGLLLQHGRLVVEPITKPKYALSELVAEYSTTAEELADTHAWQEMDPVGREVF